MRDVTYDFEELPIRVGHGATRTIVARVSGVADIEISGDDFASFDLFLHSEDGQAVRIDAKDPLYPQIRREIAWRWDNFFFDAERPLRDENREHRLTTQDVL